ncbi:MAG TPA: Zn-binding domain-containing protein, partial [Anaerolineae bacterium]|nr:Zn-binding domain-containing protein [Anaerolineae bacterium]
VRCRAAKECASLHKDVETMEIPGFLAHVRSLPSYRRQLVHVEQVPSQEQWYRDLPSPLAPALQTGLAAAAIGGLYAHQANSIGAALAEPLSRPRGKYLRRFRRPHSGGGRGRGLARDGGDRCADRLSPRASGGDPSAPWRATSDHRDEPGRRAARRPARLYRHAAFFAKCDREDIGGPSAPTHPDTGQSQLFIYDGDPGSAGISRQGYVVVEALWRRTRDLIRDCRCAEGARPACNRKGGSNDTPLDKVAAVRVLTRLLDG